MGKGGYSLDIVPDVDFARPGLVLYAIIAGILSCALNDVPFSMVDGPDIPSDVDLHEVR